MNTPSTQIARHIREVFFGGNWTASNLKDNLSDISWQQATQPMYSLNTIVALSYHIGYYVSAVLKVLQGQQLTASDKLSFDHPPINGAEAWSEMRDKISADAAALADLVEQLPEQRLWEPFVDDKYGIYFRNLFGIIEHTHYHLGQIALLKKLLQEMEI